MLKKVLVGTIWLIAIAAPALFFSMPWFVALPFVLGCLWLLRKKRQGELALILMSLALTFTALEVAIRLMADDLFYRAHERFAGHGRYVPDLDKAVKIAHGDLAAMDPNVSELSAPHEARFVTDDAGYRNMQPYSAQPYVLLGDSFVAGVNNSAENTLAEQINGIKPGAAYSLGYPGEPYEYEHRAMRFLEEHLGSDAKFIWYVFEGNDFVAKGSKQKSLAPTPSWQLALKSLSPRRSSLLTPRFLTILYKRLKAAIKGGGGDSPVSIKEIAGISVGFYKSYMNVTNERDFELRLYGNEEVMQRTACVFIIPTKYSVYRPVLEGDAMTWESAAYRATVNAWANYPQVKVIDLTAPFQARALELLDKGELLYWPDDTHWNAEGIKMAAEASLQCIE